MIHLWLDPKYSRKRENGVKEFFSQLLQVYQLSFGNLRSQKNKTVIPTVLFFGSLGIRVKRARFGGVSARTRAHTPKSGYPPRKCPKSLFFFSPWTEIAFFVMWNYPKILSYG